MQKLRVIGRIDINNKNVVKGKCLEGLRKLGAPAEYAYKYYQEGIDELVFMDAVASLYDRNSLIEVLKETCKKVFIPITIGGGIRTLDDIQAALNAGADKVAINSQGIRDINFINESVRIYGSQAITGSVVARRHRYSWEAFTDNAKHRAGINAIEWAKKLDDAGVGEIMITSIDCDGRMAGFDNELVEMITSSVSVPVIVSGGAGNSDHIYELVRKTNCEAIAISSLFHYDHEKIIDLKNKLNNNGLQIRLCN